MMFRKSLGAVESFLQHLIFEAGNQSRIFDEVAYIDLALVVPVADNHLGPVAIGAKILDSQIASPR